MPVTIKTVFNSKINSISKSAKSTSLSDNLTSLDSNYAEITSLIPNRFDFYDGETGTYISDGGNDMYDNGNYIYISNNGPLSYTNGQIMTSSYLGTSSEGYFTQKYPGLFVFEASLDNVNCISVINHNSVILAITSLSKMRSPKYLLFNL